MTERRPEVDERQRTRTAQLAASIRTFVAAGDETAMTAVLGHHPELRRPEVVGLLAAQLPSDGSHPPSALARAMTLLVGTADPNRHRLVAEVATSGHALRAPQPSYAETATAIRLVDEIVADGLPDVEASLAAQVWDAVSQLALRLYQLTGDGRWNLAAISPARRAGELSGPEDPAALERDEVLATCLAQQFEMTGAIELLEEAIERRVAVTRRTPSNHELAPRRLGALALSLSRHHEVTGALASAHRAAGAARVAVDLTPADDPDLPRRLNNLGNRLSELHAVTGDLAVLDRAIATCRRAVAAAPLDGPVLPTLLANLATHLLDRHLAVGDEGSVADAVNTARRAVSVTESDHPALPSRQATLARCLTARFDHDGDRSGLEEAVALTRRLATHAAGPDEASLQSELAERLTRLVDVGGGPEALQEAVTAARRALELTPAGDVHRLERQDREARLLGRLHAGTGDRTLLDEAVTAHQRAVDLSDPAAADHAERLHTLADALADAARQSSGVGGDNRGDGADIGRRALEAARASVAAADPSTMVLPERLLALTELLADRYRAEPERSTMVEALSVLARTLDSGPLAAGGSDRPAALARALEALTTVDGDREARDRALADIDGRLAGGTGATDPDSGADPLHRSFVLAQRLADLARSNGFGVASDEAVADAARDLGAVNPDGPAADRAKALDQLADRLADRLAADGHDELDRIIDLRTEARDLTGLDDPARARRSSDLTSALLLRHHRSEDRADLDRAVAGAREVAAIATSDRGHHHDEAARILLLAHDLEPDGPLRLEAIEHLRSAAELHPDRGARGASTLGLVRALVAEHGPEPEAEAIDDLIGAAERALDLLDPDDGHRAEVWFRLSTAQAALHDRQGRSQLLIDAVRSARSAVDEGSDDDQVARSGHLNHLANLLARLYVIHPSRRLLAGAVSAAREAVAATPPGLPAAASRQAKLAARLADLHAVTGDAEHLHAAVAAARASVDSTEADSPLLARRLNNLASWLAQLHLELGGEAELDEAIALGRRAAELTVDDGDRSDYLENLCHRLSDRHDLTDDDEALDEAIDVARRVVDLTPADSTRSSDRLDTLMELLLVRHEIGGARNDLDEATDAARRAVSATPAESPRLADYLENLGALLGRLYGMTGTRHVLIEAVATARRAVEVTEPDDPVHTRQLHQLADRLGRLHAVSGDPELLEEAVATAAQAASTADPEHHDVGRLFENLAEHLARQFAAGGERTFLDRAVAAAQKAVDTTDPGAPEMPARLTVLSTHLGRLHASSDDHAHLERAVSAARRAVALTDADSEDLAPRLNTLATHLVHQHGASEAAAPLEDAVATMRRAVAAPGTAADKRARYHTTLGALLLRLDGVAPEPGLIDEAVATAETAVAEAERAGADSERARCLDGLVAALRSAYGRRGDAESLRRATDAARRALAATPDGGAENARRRTTLVELLLFQLDEDVEPELLDEAIEHARATVPAPDAQLGDGGEAPRRGTASTPTREQLVRALALRFRRDQRASDLDEAIEHLDVVIADREGAPDDPDLHERMVELALQRFECGGDTEDLDRAIAAAQAAVDADPGKEGGKEGGKVPDSGRVLALAALLTRRHTLDPDDPDLLDRTVAASRRVVAITPDGSPELAGRLNSLANRLGARHRLGPDPDPGLVAEAVDAARRAVAATPDDDEKLAYRLRNLGNHLLQAHQMAGIDPAGIDPAVEEGDLVVEIVDAFTRATDAAESSAPTVGTEGDRAGRDELVAFLDAMATKLDHLFAATNVLDVIELALIIGDRALGLAEAIEAPDARARRHTQQATRLAYAHNASGRDDRAREAAAEARRAVALSPDDDRFRPDHLSTLANRLGALYKLDGDEGTLVETVDVARRAAVGTAASDPELPSRLNNLANHLARLYGLTENTDLLDEAVATARRAVELTSAGSGELPGRLTNLANHLTRLYAVSSDPAVLTEATTIADQAIAVIRDSSETVPSRLSSLASHLERLTASGPSDDD